MQAEGMLSLKHRRKPSGFLSLMLEYQMKDTIPMKFYDITEEYAQEAATPVQETEHDALAHYFELLITRLMNGEEISEAAQADMAQQAGINPQRIDDIAQFLNTWGNE